MTPSDRLSVEARALAYQIDNSDAYGTEQVTLSEAWTSGHAAGLSEALELADAVEHLIKHINDPMKSDMDRHLMNMNIVSVEEALERFKRAKGES